jgi:Holliday junction resolvase RusA-like endonuclease
MIQFFVPGAPVSGGSKRAFPVHGRDGKLHVSVADTSGPRGQEGRGARRLAAERAVRYENRREWQGILSGALAFSLWFFLPRPRGHVGKRGGLLPSAPLFPTTRPDVLKLARGVEDACTGILWRDDAQIISEALYKRYADDRPIGVLIRVGPVLTSDEPRATAPEAP